MDYLHYLINAHRLGRLSHAYLLSGNDQEGKERAVSGFLKHVLGKDSSQLSSHPDFHVVEPGLNEEGEQKEISIAQIRELSLKLQFAPWSSPLKVAVIRDAESLNQEAQGAFLKILEEPKGNTIFFLLTSYPGLLLETVRSRTQELRFWKFSRESESLSAARSLRGDMFQKLETQPLYRLLLFAKTWSESHPCGLHDLLEGWLAHGRAVLHEHLAKEEEGRGGLSRRIHLIEHMLFLLRTTNVNERLALERLLIDIHV